MADPNAPSRDGEPRGYLGLPPGARRRLLEQLMFGGGRVHRFTQDTPVLPDVWLHYAAALDDQEGAAEAGGDGDPFPALDLLITPFRDTPVGDLRKALRERLRRERGEPAWRDFGHDPAAQPRLVYNQTTVAGRLFFEDLVRVVLPMTEWWHKLERRWQIAGLQSPQVVARLAEAVHDPEHPQPLPTGRGDSRRPPTDLLWLLRVVGFLALVHRRQPVPSVFVDPRRGVSQAATADWEPVVAAVSALLRDLTPVESKARIHVVNRNREAGRTIARSALAVKADAARLLFNISCSELAWAVVDSGIDAAHPAFRLRRGAGADSELASRQPFVDAEGKPANCTRVLETYDFTEIALLLDPDSSAVPAHVAKRLAAGDRDLAGLLGELRTGLEAGGSFDWKLVRELLRIPHLAEEYVPPRNDHGTHVAGVLAGDWRRLESDNQLEEDLTGICPDLRLFDLRVLDHGGRGDEFAVMAALQFVRFINSSYDYTVVHGVNMSLSLRHDVSNFACGRTPVCEECERVIAAGVVVVAAAGNQGYRRYATAEGPAVEAYNSSSITDPGNAEEVLTVGATHRSRPHIYGVSYFSSRGPTGDGRAKPDLVAPGEKIIAPLPDGSFGLKDGTSMAAPHASGAAALLMARHSELVGRPRRVKEILCQTATDLGRERYFQGAGMLDILRALQSV